MLKKITTLIVIILIIASGLAIFSQKTNSATIGNPSKLSIKIGPTSVLADNSTYNCIFVQLQDDSSKPARALQDTTINLYSSQTSIGTVDPSITIPVGETYASAYFYDTFTPGTTTISATATGYSNVQASITTIGPIASSLELYGFPSTLPADEGTYEAIIIQLQDTSGSPAKAPKDGVQVTLTCSDTSVGTVTPTVTIPEGETFATASFTTTTRAETERRIVSAQITAVSQGYTLGQLTIYTTPVASNPTTLKVFVGTQQVLADRSSYKQIAIELQNATGYVARAPNDLTINLTSSNINVAKIDSELVIPQTTTYALATLNTTYKAGSTSIYATAQDFVTAQASISTFGFTPSKLAVYCSPAVLPADNETYQAIQVQLQDSQGRPAKDPESNVIVDLFSNQPTVATIGSTITIPFGSTQGPGTLTVKNTPGSTTITAQTSGYTSGQAQLTTYLIDYTQLQVSLTANPQSIANAQSSILTAYVTGDGAAVTGATITFSSDNGGTFTTTTEQGNGYYRANFTAPNFSQTTTCTITATASKTNYVNGQATTQITVTPSTAPTPTATPTPTPTVTPTPSPTATPATNTASITLLIKDTNGDPLNETIVSSTSQPSGQGTISGVTNSTGYVVFRNVALGNYTFHIVKSGYGTMDPTFKVTSQSFTLSLNLQSSNNTQTGDWLLIIIIAIVIIVVVVVTVAFLIRRRNKQRTKRLQELQKQLQTNKYQL